LKSLRSAGPSFILRIGKSIRPRLRCTVRFGVGLTDIENAEDRQFTYAFHAGLNYDLTKEFYVGAKYARYMVSGPTDKLRLQYEDISVNYFGVQLGLRF